MIISIRKRFSTSMAKGVLLAGTLLGVGALPCPECGTPVIFHIWPIAGLLVVFQVLRKRRVHKNNPGGPNNPSPATQPESSTGGDNFIDG